VQHDVVRAGNAHDIGAAGRAEQREQHIHVVLVGLGVIGVAHVHAHGQAQEFAAKVVLEPGPDDLLAVQEVFRADKSHDGVDQKRGKGPRHGIGPGLHGLLIHVVVGIRREGRTLARLEIHDVVAHRAASQGQARLLSLGQKGQIDPKAGVDRLGAADGLEHQVHRRALGDGLDGGGHVGEHAALGGNGVALAQFVEHDQETDDPLEIVGGRIDPDAGIAGPQKQAIDDRGQNALGIIRGVVGLQPGGQAAGQADGGAEGRTGPRFCRHQDEILVPHDLGGGRHHFGRQPRRQGRQTGLVRLVRKQPFAEGAHAQVLDRGKGRRIVAVQNEPGHLVDFVRNKRLFQEGGQRHVGQEHLGGRAFFGALGGDAGELVAGAFGRGLGQQLAQSVKAVMARADGQGIHSVAPLGCSGKIRPRPCSGRNASGSVLLDGSYFSSTKTGSSSSSISSSRDCLASLEKTLK